eukprot:CAMPEP_0197075988 /NCGR_PEP_ID=MMETSP1384-20130603/211888_1 /TAXON_ID=29189 /ORGANISM="Ammonia sp." /LENGTH=620 /DNA_ID=CAMNT_0042514837 /DNA_START=300 /DNA_END=2162 /DNA_ORIENTATION=+
MAGLNACIVSRGWLIYYHLHYNFAMMNQQWMLHLDPTLMQRSFWLKYKATLGSPKMVLWIVCITFTTLSVAASVLRMLSLSECTEENTEENTSQCTRPPTAAFALIAFVVFLLIVIYLLFLCKWPKLADCWYLRMEFKYLMVSTTTFLSLFMLAFIVFAQFREENMWIAFVSEAVVGTLANLMYVSLAMIPTFLILHKLDRMENPSVRNQKKRRQSTGSKSKSDNDDGPKLSAILTNEHDFVLFIHHLCKEFALETMLCFIELLQFKYALNARYPLQCRMQHNVAGMEFKYLMVSTSTFLILMILAFVVFARLREQTLWMAFVSQTVLVTLVNLMYVSLAMIPTFLILHKLDRMENPSVRNQKKRRQSTGSKSKSDNDDGPKLSAILTNEHDFVLFIHHLCKEFALETMLCFIELLQFKYALNARYPLQCRMQHNVAVHADAHDTQNDYFDFVECDISLNTVIPKSFIVHHQQFPGNPSSSNNNNGKERWLRIVHALYRKYIKVGGELEVNVSGDLRLRFMYYFHSDDVERFVLEKQEIDEIELFELFDEVIEELYHLMLISRYRFVSTEPNITMTSLMSGQQTAAPPQPQRQRESGVQEHATLRDVGRTETGEFSEQSD